MVEKVVGPFHYQENLRELELVLIQDVKHFKCGVLMSLLQLQPFWFFMFCSCCFFFGRV